MFAGWNKKANVTVRKETVRVASKPVTNGSRTVLAQRPSTNGSSNKASVSTAKANRPRLDDSPGLRTTQLRKAQKRKSESPVPSRLESDSDDDDYSSSIATPPPSKRARSTIGYQINRKGHVRDKTADSEDRIVMISGLDLTSGDAATKFVSVFDQDGGHVSAQVSLSYPGSSVGEKFDLLEPKEKDGYKPLEDIVESMETVLKYYLPAAVAVPHLDESSGFRRRVFRAFTRRDLGDVHSILGEYNQLITQARKDGIIAKHLDDLEQVPLPVIKYVLNQVYARTVSPRVELLRQYEAASNNVYGELLPPFASQIFRDTRMTPDSIFLDLGSGVGNVVLQAALEVGCEAHGIEMMENACVAARAQETEFKARCRLWGLGKGKTSLLQGDFLSDSRVNAILRQADVVLVNNQAFQPDLNDALKIIFLDMKEGARLVSLKTFANEDLKERNANDVTAAFQVERKSFYQDYVSWMGGGGNYFVATKDSAGIERRLKEKRRGR